MSIATSGAAAALHVMAWLAAQEAFAIRPITSSAQLDTQLALLSTSTRQAKCVREQIVRLVDGCGLRDYKPKKYTSSVDATIGKEGTPENLAFLRRTLEEIWAAIARERIELPDEPAVPMLCDDDDDL